MAPEDTFRGNGFNIFEKIGYTLAVIFFVLFLVLAIMVRLIYNIWR